MSKIYLSLLWKVKSGEGVLSVIERHTTSQ